MSRDVSGTVSINTQIASTSTSATGAAASGGGGNNSNTSVKSNAQNNFWQSLEKNLKDILRESDKILPEGSSETVIERSDQQATTGTGAEHAILVGRSGGATNSLAGSPNPANLATARHHRRQAHHLPRSRLDHRQSGSGCRGGSRHIAAARKGPGIPRHGADQRKAPSHHRSDHRRGQPERPLPAGHQLAEPAFPAPRGSNAWILRRRTRPACRIVPDPSSRQPAGSTPGTFRFPAQLRGARAGLSSTLSLLETFGKVKVLSSPKISVLNNQTAMLKVVDNVVYFLIKNDSTTTTVRNHQQLHLHAAIGIGRPGDERHAANQRERQHPAQRPPHDFQPEGCWQDRPDTGPCSSPTWSRKSRRVKWNPCCACPTAKWP
jgi:MSHA biogenesis protein MshL